MALQDNALLAFNRGRVSTEALARTDVKRIALSAEIMTNWMPRTLGPMLLRPGLGYIDTTYNNSKAKHIPFIFANTDTAIVEVTNDLVRARVSEAIVTRSSVATAITNGTFTTDLTGWTGADESGATSQWVTGSYMGLAGTKFNRAIRYQTVTVGSSDQNVEHALHIVVHRGNNVMMRVGSTVGGEEYIADTQLRPGTHSLAFTPTGNFTVQFSNLTQYQALVQSVAVEAAGAMTIAAQWASADLDSLRWTQSADVIFVAAFGYQQYRIERHASNSRSWSVVQDIPEDGPFRLVNTSTTTITPSALTGDVTLTASQSIFKSTHVGALFRLNSIGQKVSSTVAGAGQWSNAIQVTGVGAGRQFSITISGTWSATITLQRSVGQVGAWTSVTTWSSNTTTTFNDTFDNQVIFYRIGIDTGNYTSGSAVVTLEFSAGSLNGVALITAYSSGTSVSAAVLSDLGETTATSDWSEGIWSTYRGFPGSVRLYEGRLWWVGKNWIVGSVSDAYDSFDDTIQGDSAPIIRTIGAGPVDKINWLLDLKQLMLGTDGSEWSARSSTLDEPLTPTNFNLQEGSTQGSATVDAIKMDYVGLFVQRGGSRVYQLEYQYLVNAYTSTEVTILCPEIGNPGVVMSAVQRQPDPRIHFVKSDGTTFILLLNPAEDLKCLVDMTTDGTIEDAFVLPRTGEDAVYYVVNRTINGSTKRYLEKWSQLSECVGGTQNKQADSFTTYSQSASTTITGLSYLEAKSVVVWDNGVCLANSDGTIAEFTVSGGSITGLTHYGTARNCTTGVVGLPYTAQFKSTKLAYNAELGTGLGQRRQISKIHVIAMNMHHKGVQYGPDFSHLQDLPDTYQGAPVTQDTIFSTYDDPEAINFPAATADPDARLCLQANAPRPVELLAAVLDLDTTAEAP